MFEQPQPAVDEQTSHSFSTYMAAVIICFNNNAHKMFHHLRKWSKTKLHNAGPLVTIIYRMTQSGLKAKLLLIYLQFTQRQKLNSLMLNSNNNDNGIKKSIGLISKKKDNFAYAAHVFVRCFAIVCQDYNMELPETSLQFIHVLLRKFPFFHCCSFPPQWPLAFVISSLPQERAHSGMQVSPAWRLDREMRRRLILQET